MVSKGILFVFMEKVGLKTEQAPSPRNISEQFLSLDARDFGQFLRTVRNEPSLYVEIDWKDIWTARRLKAFLEMTKPNGQLRSAAIRATKEQRDLEHNVFGSGVKWIEVK